MKSRFFSTLLFFVLLLFALNLQGDVSYKQEPMITSFPLTFTKYIDILSEEVSWRHGNMAHVAVSAELEGLGYAFATLKNVYLMGKGSRAVYGNPEKFSFGTKDHNGHGSWESGTNWASAIRKVEIPAKAKDGDSWSWGAGGLSEISPTQYEWRESTSWGVNISIPKGITGRYTTTGSWGEGSLPVMTATAKSGTHTLEVKHICRECNVSGKTAAEIGGKSKHEKITCPEPNCSVKYHKCSTPWNHEVCSACGDRKCDGDDHSVCSGCGSYKCTVSDTSSCDAGTCNGIVTDNTPNCPDCTAHCSSPCRCTNSGTCNGSVSYHVCGEHETTVSGDHSLQASCTSTDANGNSCTVTNFYACDNHSHVYPATPPSTPTPTPPPPTPPTPTLVTCSACNVLYDPNSTSAVNLHRVRTCRFSECRQTWQRCQSSAPICNKPYRKRNGLSCSAE